MAESTALTMEHLRRLAPELQALTETYGGTRLRVFGSVVQGKAMPGSDLDLLLDFPSSPIFEQSMDLKLALEDRLRERMNPALRQVILSEGVSA